MICVDITGMWPTVADGLHSLHLSWLPSSLFLGLS